MITSILTICTGNICRSPVAAGAFASLLPDVAVSSAGLHALAGRGMDPDSKAAADLFGIAPTDHVARQFTSEIGMGADLLIVMETHHRQDIARRWPQFLGKTFLLGQFEDDKEIADPYRRGRMLHIHMAEQVLESAKHWSRNIGSF
ncbi:low molecular weight phosphotyrosine protein phosphatase [Rhodobacterales bacterium HKCCSP123]|nr:low molecular weight phosphotyrosine protein phosphatase [Rhodobacterales bacterium HKCCSP123]